MEADLVRGLQDVGYGGPLLDEKKLSQALEKGAKSPEFTGLISWFSDKFLLFENTEERIHPTTTSDDSSTFLLELSSFLKDLGCVNQQLTSGNINQRLSTVAERSTLVEYLIMELMSSKIINAKKQKITSKLEVTINESETAKCLKEMLLALEIGKPPADITVPQLFTKTEEKLKTILKSVPNDLLRKPLIIGELSKDQWNQLDKIQDEMKIEYKIRREMMLKRLDVTVQSFMWSDRIKAKADQLNACYYAKRELMMVEPGVKLSQLLASRDDLTIIEKTSNASVRKNTRNDVTKIVIGNVPDRGGRTDEVEPPPREMPSWQQNRVADASRGGRGGRGGGRRGGYRDRGDSSANFGQNQDSYDNRQASFDQPNYNNNRGDGNNERRGRGGGYQRGRGGRVQGGWAQRGYNRGGGN